MTRVANMSTCSALPSSATDDGHISAALDVTSPCDLRETILEPMKGWIGIDWQELWRGRELLYFLVWRDLKVRYKQTVLGAAWAVLQPLFLMGIFCLMFGRVAELSTGGIPRPSFYFSGLVPWLFFANGVSLASASLVNQQHLLTKIYLPRVFVPTAAVMAGVIDLAIAFVVFLGIMLLYGYVPSWQVIALPIVTVFALMATLGVSLTLSALIVSYRDFRYVVPFMVQRLMFLGPLVVSVQELDAKWQALIALNPMTGVIEAFRSAVIGQPWSPVTMVVSGGVSVMLFVFGLYYFRRTERRFADIA